MDHVLVVVSDIEMGAGGPTDDYPDTAFLELILSEYQLPPFDEIAVTFVFNGDTFDFLKTPCEGDVAYPTHITAALSLAKLERIAAAHPSFFQTVRRLLTASTASRSVVFTAGNHDQELFFEAVQDRIRELIGADVVFAGITWRSGDVLVEHGSQFDPTFAIDPDRPFVDHRGEVYLNLPWGTLALLEVVMPYLYLLYPLDRLRPHRDALAAVPEAQELLLSGFRRYWTRDYWARFFQQPDPLRRVSWAMLAQVGYRFGTGDPDPHSRGDQEVLSRNPDVQTICLGHLHQPALESIDDRRILRTGCFRNEYRADFVHGRHRLLPKVYAEIFMSEEKTVRNRLVEVDGPAPSSTGIPEDFGSLSLELRRELELVRASAEREAPSAHEQGFTEPSVEPRPSFIRTLWHALGDDR
ncbi:MAG: hypothetical protein DRJ42_30900 [Deltaproteobacteria bacterium]|nr:MAG: hypothetical protein DRJ42_30900 [Deltaproteobacteria bacterium]